MDDHETHQLAEEFLSWKEREASARVVDHEAAVEVVFLRQENARISDLLKETTKRCQELMDKLTQLTNRYTELAHVIKVKNRLSEEVQASHEKHQTLVETHAKELTKLSDELVKTKTEAKDHLTQANAQAMGKALEVEEHHQAALNDKDILLRSANENLEKEYQKHFIEMEDLKREHQDSNEKLRCRIQELQASLSSRTTSNMGIIAMKLQKTQAVHEKHLSERDQKIKALETELKTTKDNLHHQQMLSVVRGVQKMAAKQGKSANDELDILQTNEANTNESDLDIVSPDEELNVADDISDVITTGPLMTGFRKYRVEPHNRTDPITTPSPTCSKHKLVHKRKLFTGEYLMEEADED